MTFRPDRIQIQVMSAADALGGGALHARGLAQGLRQLGIRVSLLCTGAGSRDSDPLYDRVVVGRPPPVPVLWRLGLRAGLPYWLGVVRRATRDVDAVVALSPVMALVTRWARPRLPVLYVPAMLHMAEQPETPRAALEWIERRAFQSVPAVLVATPAVRRAVEHLYGPLRVPVATCPLGVDGDRVCRVSRSRAALGIPAEARLLLTVGVINANKGQRRLAAALARCARPNWWWALLGTGPERPAVERELAGTSLAARTVFVGCDPDPGDWYAAADVLVGASRAETFGLAVAEALWAGLPVLIPQNGAGVLSPLAAAVEDGHLGGIYPREDGRALVATLGRLLADSGELRAMGGRAAEYARGNFSWSRYAANVLGLLEGVLRDTESGRSAALRSLVAERESAVGSPPAEPACADEVASVSADRC